jgi:hypothetical protein
VGIIHDTSENLDTVAITSPGSDIAGLSFQEQHQMHQAIANTWRRLAAYHGVQISIRTLTQRRPYDMDRLLDSFDNSYLPDVLVPQAQIVQQETGIDPEELYKLGKITREELRDWRLNRLNVGEVYDEVDDRGRQVEMITFITVRRDKRVRKAAKSRRAKKLTDREAQRLQIIRLAREVMEGLERGSVRDPQLLDREGCLRFLEGVRSTEKRNSETADAFMPTSSQLSRDHPQFGIYSTPEAFVTDTTGHITLMITGLPKEIETNLIPRIFSEAQVEWLTVTTLAETASGRVEYIGFNWVANILNDGLDAAGLSRIGRKTERRREDIEAQQAEVADQGHLIYLTPLVTVSHVDPEALEDAAVEAERVIRLIGCNSERAPAGFLAKQAALAGLTGSTNL